jgi:cold shock CspA family protein
MRGEYFYGHTATAPRSRAVKSLRPTDRAGVPDIGRIVRLYVGQGHGFIRRANDSEVYFHRADLAEGTSINDFAVGDVVAFERLDDIVSGARARGVRRRPVASAPIPFAR